MKQMKKLLCALLCGLMLLCSVSVAGSAIVGPQDPTVDPADSGFDLGFVDDLFKDTELDFTGAILFHTVGEFINWLRVLIDNILNFINLNVKLPDALPENTTTTAAPSTQAE